MINSTLTEEKKYEEYIRIHQSDCNGIDDIEIFEVMEGGEGCVEVVDCACQATEADIALSLGLDPSIPGFRQDGSENRPRGIPSEENLISRLQVTSRRGNYHYTAALLPRY